MSITEKVKNFFEGQKLTTSFYDNVIICLSEFFGTAILLFVGCMGCVPGFHSVGFLSQQAALTSGLAVMIAIFLFGHVSGAHINPLTTIVALIIGQTPISLTPIYFLGQITGAFAGYGLLQHVTPVDQMKSVNASHAVCVTVPSGDLTPMQALLVEFLLSLILALANSTSWDYRNKDKASTAHITFGFLVSALVMAGGSYTGASMNPAKSLAPAVLNRDWERHWIYWVAPLSAAVIGGTFYRIVILKGKSCHGEGTKYTSLESPHTTIPILDEHAILRRGQSG